MYLCEGLLESIVMSRVISSRLLLNRPMRGVHGRCHTITNFFSSGVNSCDSDPSHEERRAIERRGRRSSNVRQLYGASSKRAIYRNGVDD